MNCLGFEYSLQSIFADNIYNRSNTIRLKGEKNMADYRYKTTGILINYFEDNSIPYRVRKVFNVDEVSVVFNVEAGPGLSMKFVITDDENDLTVFMMIIYKVPSDKRTLMLEACNKLNKECHHVCFYITDRNNVMFSYDFLQSITDDCIGESALELIQRTKATLDENYAELMSVLYMTDSEVNVKFDDAFRRILSDISSSHQKPTDSSKCSEEENGDE